jgi:hypothetical protein
MIADFGGRHDQKGLSPRRASRAMGVGKKERPPSRGSNQGKAASQSASKLPLGLTVGRSLLQAERSGSESRRGCQGYELVGPPGVQP